jgi:hypothetical protein
MLNADYDGKGKVQRRGNRLTVMVDLIETRTARVVWAEVASPPARAAQSLQHDRFARLFCAHSERMATAIAHGNSDYVG